MKRMMMRLILAVVMTVATAGVAAAADKSTTGRVDFQPIVQEWNSDGTPNADQPTVGWSLLRRTPDGLKAMARVAGLEPGGVYTFWWVVVQRDGAFPSDIFLAYGASAVANDQGRANARMSATLGQPGIEGFIPDGINEIPFASLDEPLTATVRIEIAYHGQADEAGDGELAQWMSDFWTGSACPPATPNPNPNQPHCPIYYSSTHSAGVPGAPGVLP